MALVKLILREDVGKLGEAGDLVSVKPGYARNFLLKRGMATIATEARINELAHHRRIIAENQAKAVKELEAFKHKIQSMTIEITATAGERGKLFGSVTMQQVAELLEQKGITIDRRKMSVPDAIKSTGNHEVTVHLRRELVAKLKVVVTSKGAPPPEAESLESDETLGLSEHGADPARPGRDAARDDDDA